MHALAEIADWTLADEAKNGGGQYRTGYTTCVV